MCFDALSTRFGQVQRVFGFMKRTAVRAWEIAALAEAGAATQARASLDSALSESADVSPAPSKSEALLLLLQAAAYLGASDANQILAAMRTACEADTHWRSKRALRNAELICSKQQQPRAFFW